MTEIVRFLKRVKREDAVGQTWTFEAGEIEDHVSEIREHEIWLNFG